MLAASRTGPRTALLQTCCPDSIRPRRYRSNVHPGKRPRSSRDDQTAVTTDPEKQENDAKQRSDAPSLFERLFPDQRAVEPKSLPPEPILPPRISVSHPKPRQLSTPSQARIDAQETHWSRSSRLLRHDMINQPPQTSVLILRNASKNLVEEDFRRLVPKGKHMDSWTMQQGDILSIVPMRDLYTLAPRGVYYLLFSSSLSAFTYQGYASRIHRMVASHTPSSILSPIPPPPGYLIDGMDAHAAMNSFTLVPPTQALDLLQLKPPLTPLVEEIVRHCGYAALRNRKGRMPFEARITMDGPQFSLPALRHVLIDSAKSRALGWSGGDSLTPRLSLWKPPSEPLAATARDGNEEGAIEDDGAARNEQQQGRRTRAPVYIAGFPTQRALQSFMAYWHRRALEADWREGASEDYESPPIANVEVLW